MNRTHEVRRDATGTKSAPDPEVERLRRQFIDTAGQFTQSLGFGRIIGQIYAHVYFSPDPQSLDALTERLGISKGSASMSVRQLEGWGALRRIWVRGDRRDYYEATDEFGRIVRKALLDLVGRKMESADLLLVDAERLLGGRNGRSPDAAHLRDRLNRLRAFRDRARGLWESPLVRLLLK